MGRLTLKKSNGKDVIFGTEPYIFIMPTGYQRCAPLTKLLQIGVNDAAGLENLQH